MRKLFETLTCILAAHKDPYENIYCVVRGHKDFLLFPPCDLPWMDYREYENGIFEKSEDDPSGFAIRPLEGMISRESCPS